MLSHPGTVPSAPWRGWFRDLSAYLLHGLTSALVHGYARIFRHAAARPRAYDPKSLCALARCLWHRDEAALYVLVIARKTNPCLPLAQRSLGRQPERRGALLPTASDCVSRAR